MILYFFLLPSRSLVCVEGNIVSGWVKDERNDGGRTPSTHSPGRNLHAATQKAYQARYATKALMSHSFETQSPLRKEPTTWPREGGQPVSSAQPNLRP